MTRPVTELTSRVKSNHHITSKQLRKLLEQINALEGQPRPFLDGPLLACFTEYVVLLTTNGFSVNVLDDAARKMPFTGAPIDHSLCPLKFGPGATGKALDL